jgi:phage terminase large subunit-like protein
MKPRSSAEDLVRTDFESYVRKAFSTINPGKVIGNQPYFAYYCSQLSRVITGEVTRAVVNMPPRHLKTAVGSVGLASCWLARKPSDKVIVVTYSETLARQIAYDVRKVMRAEWFQKLFPTRIAKDHASVTDFATVQGGGLYAVSIAGSLTGHGANLIIFDDPINIKDVDNDQLREQLNQQFDELVMSRLDNPAYDAFVLIGHRLHQDDLSGFLLQRGGFHHVVLPFIAPAYTVYEWDYGKWERQKGTVLRPDAYDAREIDRIKSSAMFDLLYQQGIGDPGRKIQAADFGRFAPHEIIVLPIVLSVDTNLREGTRNSFAVIQAWACSGRNHFLVDQWREQCNYADLWLAFKQFCDKFNPAVALIERGAHGERLISDASRKRPRLKVVGIQPDQRSKSARLSANLGTLTSGCVRLPMSGAFVADYLAEMTAARRQFWDQIDATIQYLEWIPNRHLQPPGPRPVGTVVNSRGFIMPSRHLTTRIFSRKR